MLSSGRLGVDHCVDMMGCFSASVTRVEKQRSSSAPRDRSGPLRTSVIASKDFLANKPVELPQLPEQFEEVRLSRFGEEKTATQIRRRVGEGRVAFSGPVRMVGGYESSFEGAGRACGMRTLRRTTSFGGRPQPLPLPVVAEKEVQRSRRVRSFTLEETPGSRSARRGRVAPVGGMPLPPPSLAGKIFTAADLGNFAAATTPRLSDVHRAPRVRTERSSMAVFRLAESAGHVR